MRTHFKFVALATAMLATTATAASADYPALSGAAARRRGIFADSVARAWPKLTAVLDTDRRAFDYTVTYKDLTGPVVLAGCKQPTSPPDDPIVTAPSDVSTKTIHAVVTLTPAQIRDLNDGHWIFDIATRRQPRWRNSRQGAAHQRLLTPTAPASLGKGTEGG